jgi:hypothetical protein
LISDYNVKNIITDVTQVKYWNTTYSYCKKSK